MNFYDLEAVRWTRELSASAITEDGKEHFFSGAGCFKNLAALMIKTKGQWAAHYGGGYDHLLMIPFLGRCLSAILTGSRLYSIKFANGLELIDTFPSWLCSLETVGKYVGLPKLKYDRTKLASLSTDELKTYNLRDCHIMKKGWEAAEEYCDSVGMKHKKTAGSAAIEALRVLEPDTFASWQQNRMHWETLIALPNIAPGGLTETFFMGKVFNVFCYDIKSSYPFRYSDVNGMASGIEPINPNAAAWNDPLAVSEVEWHCDMRKDDTTIAPARDAATGYANGVCRNWLCYDERMLLDSDKRISKVKHLAAFGPMERLKDACKQFLKIMYRWKESGVFFAKVWINSLHGKFCEKVCKDTWDAVKPDDAFMSEINPPKSIDGVGLWRFDSLSADNDGFAAPHYQPLNGVLVYGRARAHIISIIKKLQGLGYRVFYTDTDSVFCDCPPDIMATLFDCGNGLGQLAYEGGPFSGYILGRKLYYLENEQGETKIAAKGVPMKSLKKGQRIFGIYTERSGGRDVRSDVFKEIMETGQSKVMRTGVKPFVQGSAKGLWDRYRMVRTIKPIPGNKIFDSNGIGHYKGLQ